MRPEVTIEAERNRLLPATAADGLNLGSCPMKVNFLLRSTYDNNYRWIVNDNDHALTSCTAAADEN